MSTARVLSVVSMVATLFVATNHYELAKQLLIRIVTLAHEASPAVLAIGLLVAVLRRVISEAALSGDIKESAVTPVNRSEKRQAPPTGR